ncbi:response regulator transcription factor [Mangrovimonas yunxiaonensis]|uniref:response regulator transcription factor n=1 Tax=Mangrovimonas yunxiaonensis TaxID=1197477 RepID=UPI000A0506D8|nr:LuxR C-terminal-related transcriptional regulator [Mangrovimonas yunxiaonensis]
MKNAFILGFLLWVSCASAQYSFSGHVNHKQWHNNVYLSVIEDYRKISGVYYEQIISKINTDSLGYFEFTGNELENDNRIYRIHVDNCFDDEQSANHFNGHCDDSKEIVFIAKNNDTVVFPFSFDKQMFCNINATNPKTAALVKIDSLKDDMKFAYGEFRSEASRKLNNKKWFKTFQSYGEQLNEPLAELYIYAFLSNRSHDLHEYYLKDLENNPYYDKLLNRLKKRYPDLTYTAQYENELASDKYSIQKSGASISNKHFIIYALLVLSLLGNAWLWSILKKHKTKKKSIIKETLTNQEQKVLDLLLEEKTNKEIAKTLFISLSTVKTHVNNVYRKLNVQSREEAKSLFTK